MRIFSLTLALWIGVDFVTAAAASSQIADAQDVLGNLSKYDKLYVSYQNCAWSTYDQGCDVEGADGDDGSLWYMGLTECYRSNVAYTLYGVLKGAQDTGCSKATFINSFFTTSGIEYFTESMAAAGVAFTENDDGDKISSECNVVEAENGDDAANSDYATNNRKIFADDTSYGVGCVDKAFAMKKYQGRYCDERNEPHVTDSLKTFNSEISKAKCVVVYDAASSNNNNQDENGGEANDEALNLLTYSEACNILNFPEGCPDPYGKLKTQARSTAHAVALEANPRREKAKTAISWILLIFGVILLIASAWAYYRKRMAGREVEKTPTKKKGIFAGSLNTSSSKLSNKSESSSVNRKKTGFWGKLRRGKS